MAAFYNTNKQRFSAREKSGIVCAVILYKHISQAVFFVQQVMFHSKG
jgi:hypothetical protein